MLQTKTPSEVEDPSRELDALIEEARRRARMRRLTIAGALAAGSLALGAVFLFGGDGGGGSSGGTGSGDEGSAATGPQSSSSASADYRCPTSRHQLRELAPPGPGIPGCKVTILADLPEGWEQEPQSVVTFPPGTIGTIVSGSSNFANFDLGNSRRDLLRPAVRTIPNDGVLLSVTATQSSREAIRPTFASEDLRPSSAGSRAFIRERVEIDGIELMVESHAGNEPVDPALVDDVAAIIASLDTAQKLCPCGEHLNLDRPTLEMLERRDQLRIDLRRPGG